MYLRPPRLVSVPPVMNFANLKLAILALIFAWSQVCCCQAWAFMAAAQGAVVQNAPLSAPAAVRCCGGDAPELPGSATCETSRHPQHPPCQDHNTCAGCVPRLGWVPEGPDMLAPDLIGAALPPALFIETAPLLGRSTVAAAGQYDPSPPSPAPTLLRLHCALLV
jgi:hypothetical protein